MKHARYQYRSEEFFTVYKFESEGTKGTVEKLVLFTETNTENVYNLAFGDFDKLTGELDDFAVANNGDSGKVLATVAIIVYEFLQKHPIAWVTATGSTAVRTRLYQIGISNNLEEICAYFSIFRYNAREEWERFAVGGKYEVFLITTKGNELSI